MKTLDRISVLIAAYKNAELVKRCMDSLRVAFGDFCIGRRVVV